MILSIPFGRVWHFGNYNVLLWLFFIQHFAIIFTNYSLIDLIHFSNLFSFFIWFGKLLLYTLNASFMNEFCALDLKTNGIFDLSSFLRLYLTYVCLLNITRYHFIVCLFIGISWKDFLGSFSVVREKWMQWYLYFASFCTTATQFLLSLRLVNDENS